MIYDGLESAWPVHGSVLHHDGKIWLVAGRSSYLDGGMRLYRVSLPSGELLSTTPINNRDDGTGDTTGCIEDNLMNTPVFSSLVPGSVPECQLGSTLTADQISIIQSSDIVREIAPVPLPAAGWLFASALGVFGYLGKRKASG